MAAKQTLIDLAERFGDRFLVGPESSHVLYWGEPEPSPEPHELRIECENGYIVPKCGDRLVAVTSRRKAAAALTALACVQVGARDGETRAAFRVDDFDAVAAIMRPYPKTRLTQKERAARFARRIGRGMVQEHERQLAKFRARRAARLAGEKSR
ncbi:MAG: hypothetical protein DCC68_25430 [Planctomycetota bacterium]|nr:MAG: hypothetical protein DCC68_25430 [Planctomycetota bacterium]